ncbi:hypothetical protein, partial [Escherichia coli]|uniref:hypothetical protein n=1 Tax=Escherichia coli TaxID=562 RepID=UPI0035629954
MLETIRLYQHQLARIAVGDLAGDKTAITDGLHMLLKAALLSFSALLSEWRLMQYVVVNKNWPPR